MTNMQHINPIQDPKYFEFALMDNPDKRDLISLYELMRSQRWVETELTNLGNDEKDWNSMTESERQLLTYVLSFFLISDGVVNHNLAENFMREVTIPEAKACYWEQGAMEIVHAKTYTKMAKYYLSEQALEDARFALQRMPAVRAKTEWALKWIESDNFVERLVAFAIVEGMFFAGSFATLAWLKHVRKLMINSFGYSNDLIQKDENVHMEISLTIYQNYIHPENKLPESRIHEIAVSAMEAEKEFVLRSVPVPLLGINADDMIEYLHFTLDTILVALGCNKLYYAKNPFPFMETFGTNLRVNKFENNNPNYEVAEKLSNAEFDMEIDDI